MHPKKPKVPNREVIVLGTATLDDKDELIAAEAACFTEPHYDGYKAVLVRLPDADEALLGELAHRPVAARGATAAARLARMTILPRG